MTQNNVSITTTYLYNEQNRLVSTASSLADGKEERVYYYYDNNGNQVCRNKEIIKPKISSDAGSIGNYVSGLNTNDNVSLYKYNVWDQLVETIEKDQTVNCKYNGEGLRIEKTINGSITRYLYEYDKVILETDGGGQQLARNVYGINLINRKVSNDTMFYMYNGHGDVTALLGIDGTIKGTYYYDAFGNILEHTGTDSNITYAGYQYDKETDLYYLNARYYDSKIARFMSEDTYTGNPNDPLSLNLYTYCLNNPIMYTDPTGHSSIQINSLDDALKYVNQQQQVKSELKKEIVKVNSQSSAMQYAKKEQVKLDKVNKQYSMPTQKQQEKALVDYEVKKALDKKKEEQKIVQPVKNSNEVTVKGTGKSNSLLNNVINTGKDYFQGVAVSGDKNLLFGAGQGISGKTVEKDTIAFKVGKVSGDALSMVAGANTMVAGGGGELIGVALDGTVVLAPAGVVVAVKSAALIAYGGTAAYKGATNYFKDANDLISNITEGTPKTIPNPNGRNGGIPHQTTIDNIKPASTNGRMQTEYKYNTPNGTKSSRYADKVEIVDGEVTKIYQVGKVNQNGLPVSREAKAIEDIMNSPDYNGVPIYFMPYNSTSGPIIYLP